MKILRKLLESLKVNITKLEEKTKQVDKIILDRTNPYMALEIVARSTPKALWLESLKIDSKSMIKISGGSNDFKSIGDFIRKINSSVFFKDTFKLDTSKTKEEKSGGREGSRIEMFEMSGKIIIFNPFL